MKTITATKARNEIYKLIDEAAKEKRPIQITGKRTNAVLISEEDWKFYSGNIVFIINSWYEGVNC